ncbi:MAG TPA: serine/threonine-protein kinase [Planktothrix sp.]
MSYKIDRALPKRLMPMPGTDRLPRFRVHVPSNAKDLLVGVNVASKYYVLSILGHGGMSVVYKAKTLNRSRPKIVALKTLRMQGLNDQLLVKRFQREAELLSHLNHPRIVQVHDYGYTKRGQPYFVMDYLIGDNLSGIIQREGCVSVKRARNIFNQVCGAVDHAHRCGVIHRDLKPGNIMLMTLDGEKDYVKVVDFGIARFEEEAQRLTRMGEVWGSPVYMSPEQCMGAQLDARSDIYSMGIVMYEALTGQVPFLGKNYVETMSQQIGEPPPPFCEAAPHIPIPAALEAVVMKTLAKEPEKRYQSMAELREDLENAFPEVGHERRKKERVAAQRISQQKLRTTESGTGRTAINAERTPLAKVGIFVMIGCVLAALGYFGMKLISEGAGAIPDPDTTQSEDAGGSNAPGAVPLTPTPDNRHVNAVQPMQPFVPEQPSHTSTAQPIQPLVPARDSSVQPDTTEQSYGSGQSTSTSTDYDGSQPAKTISPEDTSVDNH